MTTIETALAAYAERRRAEQDDAAELDIEAQETRAVDLAASGFLSKRAIIDITGLPDGRVHRLIEKSERTGGRLNPETLSLIFDVAKTEQDGGPRDHRMLRTICSQGTSANILARFTGISRRTISDIVLRGRGES